MSKFILSSEADQDMIDIYLYTREYFGIRQAEIYSKNLIDSFQLLAEHPRFGRFYSPFACRFECQGHSIYYQIKDDHTFILKILHQRMDPGRYLI